jgi:recombination protein RecA
MQETIHSGSTLLNLALSGEANGGWKLGRISNIVGDRSSGKTLLAIEAATLFINHPPKGLTPKVVYYEAEAAFDQQYAASLGMPVDAIDFRQGETVEHLFKELSVICEQANKQEGTLVILDSLDALTSEADIKKDFGKQDYDRKAAKLSELFRKLVRPMEDANIHLMVISQVRENIGALPFSPKYKRSGGKALDFYCSHILWLAEAGKVKNSKTDKVCGIKVEAKVTKNKVSNPYRNAGFPILFGYGVDNIDSLLTFLSDDKIDTELRIKKATGGYYLFDDQKMRNAEMIEHIENTEGLYLQLVNMAQAAWDDLEDKTKINRRAKSDLMNSSIVETKVKKEKEQKVAIERPKFKT